MLNTSADYKTAIAATDREMRGYVKFNGDSTKIMRGCDGLISIVTTAQIADQERPMFGCACADICEMTFYNSGLPAGVSLANSYFDAYVGIVLEDTGSAPVGSIEPDTATVEYVFMGRFTIDTIDRSKLSTKVIGYDDFSKLNKPYVCNVAETPSGYPINQIIGDIRTQCGLTASATPSTNMGYVPEIYECTCRQMYGWVMSLYSLGCNWIARGNDVQYNYYTTVWGAMQYKDDPGHLITDDTIYLGGLADSPTFTFNSVVTGTEDNPVSVGSGTGIVGENPYFDAARATLLYNNINGLTFTPMSIEWRGDPAIQQGDIMKVVTGGNTYYTYVQRIVSTFNGGFKQTFECYGDSEFHYDMSTSPTEAKIKTAVSNMAQENQQEIETADNGVITKVLDLDGSWKELVIANNQDLSAATSVWRWNINGLAHSTAYSGGTYNFAVDMNGRIIANAIQTGILTDAANKNSWNLDTGAFSITDGSVSIHTSAETNDVIELSANIQQTSALPVSGTVSARIEPTLFKVFRDATYYSNPLEHPEGRKEETTAILSAESGTPAVGLYVVDYDYDGNISRRRQTRIKNGSFFVSDTSWSGGSETSSNSAELQPNLLTIKQGTVYTELDYSGLDVYWSHDLMANLGKDALTFYNSSGTVTATYPATSTQITRTHTTNSYCSSTATGRVWIMRQGSFGVMHFNLAIDSTSLTNSAGQVEIMRFSGITLQQAAFFNIPSQSGESTILMTMSTAGVVTIYTAYGRASGFYRAEVPLMIAS